MDKFPGSAKGRHRLPFDVLYEDRDVIVIDKPAGMLAHAIMGISPLGAGLKYFIVVTCAPL